MANVEKIRVLNIFSNLEHSKMFELTAEHLDRERFDFRVLFLNPARSEGCVLERFFRSQGIPTQSWVFRGKRDYLTTFWRLIRHLREQRYDVVHTHLIWAHYVGIPAAWIARVPTRLMTRWHATVHHAEHSHGLKYDRLVNRLATRIITPGSVTYRIVTEWEHVSPAKVTLLSPPLDVDGFRAPSETDVKLLRDRYNPDGRHPVIGVVSRWVEWKGIQYVIPAVERLIGKHPDLLLLLFNASGDYANQLRQQLRRLPDRNYRVVEFEPMNEALYQLFDVFVHVPVDEFVENTGGVYSEALAAGVPSIFTLSGVATGIVEHLKHCYVVPYRDSDAIFEALTALLSDQTLSQHLRSTAATALPEDFRVDVHLKQLETLYAGSRSVA